MKAQVVLNEDPLNRGRVKVLIPGIMESKDFGELPWVNNRSVFPGGDDAGSLMVPKVGTWIIVEEEMPGSYVYTGSWNTSSDKPQEYENPNIKILYKSETGHTIYLDDTIGAEKLRIIDRAGQIVEMACPMKKDTDKRGTGNVINGGAKTVSDKDGEVSITIKNLSGSLLKFVADINGGVVNLEGADGSKFFIDCENEKISVIGSGGGKVEIDNSSNTITINDSTIELGTGASGIQTKETIPFSDFSGRPFPGLPNVKA